MGVKWESTTAILSHVSGPEGLSGYVYLTLTLTLTETLIDLSPGFNPGTCTLEKVTRIVITDLTAMIVRVRFRFRVRFRVRFRLGVLGLGL